MHFSVKRLSLAVSILALLGAALAEPAEASPSDSLTPFELNQARETMSAVGIESATQDSLIAKLVARQPLDSTLGAAPVQTYTEELNTAFRTVMVFEDGSRR